jgi:decaprenyl-phosphate phosphoribosyltransferase
VLVFLAPASAGALGHLHPFLEVLATFGIFCAASSATYLFNDSMDAESDRYHPDKRHRPIAAGRLSIRVAISVGLGLAAVALATAWALAGWKLALVVVAYVGLSAAYTLHFKREPVIELAFVASGFVLRAIAGGVATHVPLSNWFLAVTCFGALFMATGKRAAELQILGENPENHRRALSAYSQSFLHSVLTLTASVTVTSYCLWAFGSSGLAMTDRHDQIWIELTVIPMVLGVLHVLRRLDGGEGGAPEDLVLGDRILQSIGLAWLALFAVGVYT